ncbi:MAG: hypothetical protein HY875_02795 [Chloroflexi bacterium]|nr:hypothetical protein [Chloroflexota bacterium]
MSSVRRAGKPSSVATGDVFPYERSSGDDREGRCGVGAKHRLFVLVLAATGALVLAALMLDVPFAGRPGAESPGAPAVSDGQPSEYPFEVHWYSQEFGVSLAEAARRIDLQQASHTVKQQLRALAPDRLSAVWLEHEPEFRLVAWYTGNLNSLPDASDIIKAAPLKVELRGGAPYAESEAGKRVELVAAALPAGIDAAGLYMDETTGVIHVELQPGDRGRGAEAALAAMLSAKVGGPVTVETLSERAGDD